MTGSSLGTEHTSAFLSFADVQYSFAALPPAQVFFRAIILAFFALKLDDIDFMLLCEALQILDEATGHRRHERG